MVTVELRGHIPLPNLRAWRTHRVLTREKLAAKAGLTESALAKIELGKTQGARFSTVDKLARALEVKPTQLIHEAPPDTVKTV